MKMLIKGFTFEIKEDPTNVSNYTKRFAQALNLQKVPVLQNQNHHLLQIPKY